MLIFAKGLYEEIQSKRVSNSRDFVCSLRKHAYSNILKILPPKNENFQIKNADIFQMSAQNIDCGSSLEPPRQGSSNEYPQSMFLSRNKKNNVYLFKYTENFTTKNMKIFW